MIWIYFFITVTMAAIASFKSWPIWLIATFGVISNCLWAYLASNTTNKDLLLKYAAYWDVAYVLIFAIIPVLMGVRAEFTFWVGISLVLIGIWIISF